MNYVPFVGFAPDADPTTPGVMVDCDSIIPSDRGFRAMPGRILVDNDTNASISVFPDAAIIGAGALRVDNFQRVYAGTANKIFALRFTSDATAFAHYAGWEDVSRAGGYTVVSGDKKWMFDSFGDYALAAFGNPIFSTSVTLQVATSAGKFDDIPGAPSCAIVVCVNRFVMALNISDYGNDGWRTCARDNHTDWSLNAATGCAQGRLVDAWGPITAGIAFDDAVLVFKELAFYLGTYTGAPEVWTFNKQAFKVGCMGPACVTKDTRGMVYFLAIDGLYSYDGAVVEPLMKGRLSRWWTNEVQPGAVGMLTEVVYDAVRDIIWIGSQAALQGDVLLAFHIPTARWGKTQTATRNWEIIFSLPVDFSETVPLFFLAPGDEAVGIFGTTQRLSVLAGDYTSVTGIPTPMVTTGDFGDVDVDTELHAVRMKFITAPAMSTLTPMHRAQLDATLVTAAVVARSSEGRYDTWQNDRWHRLRFDLRGETEFSGYAIDADAVDVR